MPFPFAARRGVLARPNLSPIPAPAEMVSRARAGKGRQNAIADSTIDPCLHFWWAFGLLTEETCRRAVLINCAVTRTRRIATTRRSTSICGSSTSVPVSCVWLTEATL